jgi:hypothetical protein
MSESITPHPAGHDVHGQAATLPFTDAEWQQFQKDDIHGGGAIVVLMASIFSIGLLLYATVALIVSSDPYLGVR